MAITTVTEFADAVGDAMKSRGLDWYFHVAHEVHRNFVKYERWSIMTTPPYRAKRGAIGEILARWHTPGVALQHFLTIVDMTEESHRREGSNVIEESADEKS